MTLHSSKTGTMSADKPRILMFAPLCYPPAGSEAIATAKLVLAAMDAGWELDVVCQADFGQYYPATADGAWESVGGIVHSVGATKTSGVLPHFRHWAGMKAFTSLQSLRWAREAWSVGSHLLSGRKYDFILSRATPQYGHLPALMLSRSCGLPWIANWSDPIPPAKAPPPYGRGSHAAVPFYVRQYCSAVARRATWHTFPCDRLLRYVSSYLPQMAGKSSVIPHIALGRFRSDLAVRNKEFSMCHAGSLGVRDPDVFLNGVRTFLDRMRLGKDIRVTFVGPPLGSFRATVTHLNLDGVVSIEGTKSYEVTQQILARADVLVVLEPPFDEGIFFPSKFVDLVQTGRPILAVSPVDGTISDIVSANGGGIVADCRSSDAVAQAVERLYSAWAAGTLDRDYGSAPLFSLFSEEYVLGQYSEIFERTKSQMLSANWSRE